MKAYGIRITNHYNYDDIQGNVALEKASKAIERRIGMDHVIGTRTHHTLEETFFFVKEKCLAEEAVDAIINEGVLAEYLPLTVSEETQTYQKAEIIGVGGLSSPLT